MAKRMMKKKREWKHLGRRGLSLFLAMVMMISLIQIGAFADSSSAHSSEEQIQGVAAPVYYTYNNGFANPNDEASTDTESWVYDTGDQETAKVSIEKKIEGTNVENQFDITLSVKTKQQISQTLKAQDAALVLVLDVSNSMKNVNILKTAAAQIATAFMGEDGDAKRELAVVSFNKDAYGILDWCDLNAEGGFGAFEESLGKLALGVGTNTEGGLLYAKHYLDTMTDSTIENKFVVLLTDGSPNAISSYYTDDYTDDVRSGEYCGNQRQANIWSAKWNTAWEDNSRWPLAAGGKYLMYYDNTQWEQYSSTEKSGYVKKYNPFIQAAEEAKTAADAIRATGVPVYTVGYGTAGMYIGTDDVADGKYIYQTTIETNDWLERDIANAATDENVYAYTADETSDLTEVFKTILVDIKEQLYAAEAWTVTDPMGDHIQFVEVDSGSKSGNQFTAPEAYANGTLTWDLKTSTPSDTRTVGGETEYTYTLKYRVQLDNLHSSGYQLTNKQTTLRYRLVEDQQYVTDANGKIDLALDFKVPAVRGLFGKMNFQKVNGVGGPIAGVQFTLTHSETCGCNMSGEVAGIVSGESGADGMVSFGAIPSGHKYTMTETKAPDNVEMSSKTYDVSVAWGETTLDSAVFDTDGAQTTPSTPFTVENSYAPQETQITLVKKWNGTPGSQVTLQVMQVVDLDDRSSSVGKDNAADRLVEKVTMDAAAFTGNGVAAAQWSETVTVPSKNAEDGTNCTYYVVETDVKPTNYVSGKSNTTTPGADGDSKTITISNTITGKTDLTLEKTWVGPADGREAVTLILRANGTPVTDAGNNIVNGEVELTGKGDTWTKTLTDLPVYDTDGKEITYDIAEKGMTGTTYTVTKNESSYVYDVSYYNSQGVLGVKNTIQPGTTAVTGTKTWVDGNGADRPANLTIKLMANGVEIADLTTDAAQSWTYTFYNLPEYAVSSVKTSDDRFAKLDDTFFDGTKITYTVDEDAPGGDYEKSEGDGYDLINTLDDSAALTVKKAWFGENAEPELKYDTVVVETEVDSEGEESGEDIVAAEPETQEVLSENQVTVWVQVKQNGQNYGDPIALTRANDWTETLKIVPEYDATGARYTYTVVELDADGNELTTSSTAVVDGKEYTVSYTKLAGVTLKNGDAELGVTNTIKDGGAYGQGEILVKKDWVDGENAKGTRLESVTLRLTTNTGWSKDVVLNGENNWQTAISKAELPAYDNGEAVTGWTIVELDASGNAVADQGTIASALEGDTYTVTYAISGDTYTATNTLKQRTDVAFDVTKKWVDGSNAQGTRPDSVTFGIFRGETKVDEAKLTTANAAEGDGDTWSTVVSGLDRYDANGAEIVYAVKELGLNEAGLFPGTGEALYTPSYDSGDTTGHTMVNTLNNPTSSIPVSKTWIDAGGSKEHAAVTLNLMRRAAGSEEAWTAVDSIALSDANGWGKDAENPVAFINLPAYSDDYAVVYEYKVEEAEVEGYTASYNGGHVTNTEDTITTDTSVNLNVVKQWIAPEPEVDSITAKVYRYTTDPLNREFVQDVEVAPVTGGDGKVISWSGSAEGLRKYDDDGNTYTYVVEEAGADSTVEIDGMTYDVAYSSAGNDHIITNTIRQDKTDVTVVKAWEDVPAEVNHPSRVKVFLKADGVKVPGSEQTLTAAAGEDGTPAWTYTWKDLDVYALGEGEDGHEIRYTVEEEGTYAAAARNGEEGVMVKFERGDGNQFYRVTTSTSEDGTAVTLTNTYEKTDRYCYRVDRVYNYYYNGELQSSTAVTGSAADGTAYTGVKDEMVQVLKPGETAVAEADTTYTTDQYKDLDGKSEYTYISGTPAAAVAAGEGEETAESVIVSVTLTETKEYVITLTYEYRETYVPEGPGGGGGTNYYYRIDYVYTGYGVDGDVIYSDEVTGRVVSKGTNRHAFTADTAVEHDGHSFALVGDEEYSASLVGTRRNNPYVFTVYYEFTEIEEPVIPDGDKPGDPVAPPVDSPVETPVEPPVEEKPVEIPDEEAPRADVPETGDDLMFWIMAAAASGMGLVYMAVTGKKKEELAC